jgi:hypothetical protein
VTVVSIYPGLVRTEAVRLRAVFDLSKLGESEFIGRAIAPWPLTPQAQRVDRNSRHTAAALRSNYGFSDVDGNQPRRWTEADI